MLGQITISVQKLEILAQNHTQRFNCSGSFSQNILHRITDCVQKFQNSSQNHKNCSMLVQITISVQKFEILAQNHTQRFNCSESLKVGFAQKYFMKLH